MHFIIFGAGNIGIKAWDFLQNDRVRCFADNYKAGQRITHIFGKDMMSEKEIIDFSSMLEIYQKGESIIVVASGNYSDKLEEQLKKVHIRRYFVFRESDTWRIWSELPFYRLFRRYECVTYTKRLADHCVARYKKIAILGCNEFLPYLISAIAFQTGFSAIYGVVDTPEAHEINRLGLPVLEWEDVKENADFVVVNSHRSFTYYCDELEEIKQSFHILRLFEVEQEMPLYFHPELVRYKDIHRGKRCFLLGNGPSLTIEDLELLYHKNEICFGCNRVYKVYPKTNWRANYLLISDFRIIKESMDVDWDTMPGEKFVTDHIHRNNEFIFDSFQPIHYFEEAYYPRNYPRFSDDITKGVYLGWSVIYDMALQIAAYMGFSEMYLLGVDMSFADNITDPEAHFIDDYLTEKERIKYKDSKLEMSKVVRAFEKAEKYSRQHGFRIYNATRGGNLETFERVNFDDLF